jgi:ABC-type antimicrobial peptide transport system permease subunit
VAVINETAARYHFPGENPIGKTLPLLRDGGEIVGIARDSRLWDVREVPKSLFYQVAEQEDGLTSGQTIYLRTEGDAASYAPILRREVGALDDTVPVYEVKTFAAQKDEALARERLIATLSGFFAGLALLLAAIGIYGVVAYGVVARTREIGVRMSLGASRGNVVWMVLRGSLALAAAGVAIGLPLCLRLSRLIENLLFGVEPNDPATLAATVTILAAAAGLAAAIPARRAARVDPLAALRHE